MAKYIDADLLMAVVEKHITEVKGVGKRLTPNMGFFDAKLSGIYDVMSIINSLQQEQQEVDLEKEKAARLYAIPHYMKDIDVNHIEEYPYDTGLEAAFIAGAKWDRSQMLKEAVEAKIYGYDDGSFELIASWLDMPNNSIYKDGDKVRIIIVKED